MLQQIPRVLLRNTLEEKTLRRNKCRICMKLQFGQACFRQICNNASNTLRGLLAIAQITALWTFHRAKVDPFGFSENPRWMRAAFPCRSRTSTWILACSSDSGAFVRHSSQIPSAMDLNFGARLTPAFTPLTSK